MTRGQMLIVSFLLMILGYLGTSALRQAFQDQEPTILYVQQTIQPTVDPVTGISDVHDGDTMTATITLPLGISYTGNIRAKGYDAFELKEPKGPPAQEYLAKLVKVSRFFVGISLTDKQKDSFGRVLGTLMYEDKDGNMIMLSDDMRKHGFVNEDSPWSHVK